MTPDQRIAILTARTGDYFGIMRTTIFTLAAIAAIIELGSRLFCATDHSSDSGGGLRHPRRRFCAGRHHQPARRHGRQDGRDRLWQGGGRSQSSSAENGLGRTVGIGRACRTLRDLRLTQLQARAIRVRAGRAPAHWTSVVARLSRGCTSLVIRVSLLNC
jgi:hypothetical protein